MAAPTAIYAQNEPTPATPAEARLHLRDLPAAAQKTVKAQAAGREIVKIERAVSNGRTGFRVQFTDSERNPDVYVAEDGSLIVIQPEEKTSGAIAPLPGTTLEDTPPPVQQTIRREVGPGFQITKIARLDASDKNAFKVTFKDSLDNGYDLQIGQDGKIVYDSRKGVGP